MARVDVCSGGQFPLGFELLRGAHQCAKSLDAMQDDNLAWIEDYYPTYVKSLTSTKDLVPKTPRRTRKRKTAADDKPAVAPPYPKRSTRAQGKDNSKLVQQLPAEAVAPARAVVPRAAAATCSLRLQDQRQNQDSSTAALPSELSETAAAAEVTSPSAAAEDITSPATKCRVPVVRIAGFESMNVKNKALAYEALVAGKSERTGTPNKGSKLTPGRLAKTPRSHAVTPSHSTHVNGKPDELLSGSVKRTSTAQWIVTEMSDATEKTSSCVIVTSGNHESEAAEHGQAAVASGAKAATPSASSPRLASNTIASKPPAAASCSSPAQCTPSSSSKSRLPPSSRQRHSTSLRARTSLRKAGSMARRISARQPASREPSSSGAERPTKKESSGRVAAAEPGARDSVDSGYPESIRGGFSKTGKGSAASATAAAAEQDSSSLATSSVELRDDATQATVGGWRVTEAKILVPAHASALQLQTSDDEELVTDEPGVPCRLSTSSKLSSSCSSGDAAQAGAAAAPAARGFHSKSPTPKDDGISVSVASTAAVPYVTGTQSNNLRSRTKVISRKDPTSVGDASAQLPEAGAASDARVTRSKMRVAKVLETNVPVCEPPTPSESRSGMKRQSDDTACGLPVPPAKQMREAIVKLPQIASAAGVNALPIGSAMKKTTTDSCLLNKKYFTPDNVRTVGLTMTNSGQKSFLSASKSTSSLLNRSLTSPGQSRIAALVTTFVKRTIPIQSSASAAVDKQKLKEKKLQEKELASTENKKRRDDLLQERLDTIKRQREEKLKRAADTREQQEREKLEKQRLIEQKQAEKVDALNRAKESKIREEKEKAKMRDLKLQEAEDRRRENELKQQKQKEEEEAAKARRARELEEQERSAAAALKAQQEAARRAEKADRLRAAAAAAASTAAAGARADQSGGSALAVQPCSVRVLAGALSEKERVHEERKAQVIAEERRMLAAAAAASSKAASSHLTTIEECPKAASAEAALKDSTNAGSASSAEKSTNARLTITKAPSSAESYAITPPPPATSRRRPLANPDNYDISDLNSGDETDDETRPRKVVPLWAQGSQLKLSLVSQYTNPPDLDALFPECLRQPCDLAAVFRRNKPRYKKRTSSAVWDSPLLKSLPTTTAK